LILACLKLPEADGLREADEGMEDEAPDGEADVSGRARRQRGWKRGVVETKMITVNMRAWVHKKCGIMYEDALIRLQGIWESPEQNDERIVRMNDLEWDYWMGTEV
jgi:hypothetical protein